MKNVEGELEYEKGEGVFVITLNFIGLGLLFCLLAIPAILQKIKPNQIYGFRTPKTLADHQIWYKANKVAGIDMFIGGVVIIFASIASYFFSPFFEKEGIFTLVLTTVTVVVLVVVLVHSFIYLKSL